MTVQTYLDVYNYGFTTKHVSSLYIMQNWPVDPLVNYATEIGWYWDKDYGKKPKFFGFYWSGLYTGINRSMGNAYGGPYLYIKNTTATTWIWVIGGTKKWTVPQMGFGCGRPQVSSERWAKSDNNYSHFSGLQRMSSTGGWSYWTNLCQLFDNDNKKIVLGILLYNGYKLVKSTNRECYVVLE